MYAMLYIWRKFLAELMLWNYTNHASEVEVEKGELLIIKQL